MSQKEQPIRADEVTASEGYEPPAIAWEEPFEPMAHTVSCAKVSEQSAQCNLVPSV